MNLALRFGSVAQSLPVSHCVGLNSAPAGALRSASTDRWRTEEQDCVRTARLSTRARELALGARAILSLTGPALDEQRSPSTDYRMNLALGIESAVQNIPFLLSASV